MSIENSKILKRQIEILGFVIMERERIHDIYELALLYGVSEITIQRDLQALRRLGINIGSAGDEGVKLYGTMNSETITKLLLEYLAINYSEYLYEVIDFGTEDSDRKLLIENFVNIQNAIENRKKITILLKDEKNSEVPLLHYEPRLIFRYKYNWSVLLTNNFEYTIINISEISEIRQSEDTYEKISKDIISQNLNKILKTKIQKKKYNIKLAFAKLEKINIPRNIMKVNIYKEKEDGKVELEGEVGSLDEVAGWIFSKSKDVLIIEPEILQDKVFELLKEMNEKFGPPIVKIAEPHVIYDTGIPYGIRTKDRKIYFQLEEPLPEPEYFELDMGLNISIYSN